MIAAKAVFEQNSLDLHKEREQGEAVRGASKWRCCCCLKCEKVSQQKGMQLEDFNWAMLRFIYGFHLVLIGLFVFVVGLLLIPIGYCCVLLIKIRLLKRAYPLRKKRELFMLRSLNEH